MASNGGVPAPETLDPPIRSGCVFGRRRVRCSVEALPWNDAGFSGASFLAPPPPPLVLPESFVAMPSKRRSTPPISDPLESSVPLRYTGRREISGWER